MSYREKPQLKLYKYENSSFILQAQIDDYQECSFEDNLYEAGQFSITINFNIPNSQLFQRGLFIQFGNSWKFGEITKIQDQISEEGKGSQYRIITGFDARYILKRRVIKNMNSNGLWVMTGKGELVLRNLIADQAGANAEAKRQLPIINTIPDSETAIGEEYSVSEQFSNLYEVCKTIATQSEIGWRLEFNGTSLNLVCFNGTDRTQTVQFSTSFDSLANGQFIDSSESFSNAIYVGGKGQNDDRDIYEGESAIEGNSPAGLDRFESWDNQSSMTTESEYETEALSMLNQYGQTLTMSGNGLAKCPYEYEKEYFTGDKIKIAFSGKSANAQILSVTEHWAFGAYEINFSFGKPLPDLNAQLQLMLRKIQTASNKTNSKDSVRWYDIPTDTAMPASDVTYTHIGFTGNVGSGATFTLYRDSSGTGSKTYHVYIKQLGGSGKLTLTTGVSGASNLVLNPGTYVAIIYVDENGNITSQGMTATGLIESGNNQPATSDGVASAIQDVTDIASSLPTDAVLHYSFDEVPDYPDSTAIYRRDYNWTTSTWASDNNNTTYSVTDGIAKWTTTSSANCQLSNTFSTLAGMILKIKFRASIQNIRYAFIGLEGSTFKTFASGVSVSGWNEVSALIPSTFGTRLILQFQTGSSDVSVEIAQIYIGDGSYSTPIIDNVNGQNNATNNGGIAVQGVSGKGAYFLNEKDAQVNGFNLTDNFSISLWVKPENNTAQLQGIIIYKTGQFQIRNGGTGSGKDNIQLYLFSPNGIYLNSYSITQTLLTPNIWSHIVFTKNGTNVKFFINGSLVFNKTITGTEIAKNNNALVLHNNSNTRPQSYDDLLIFDRALSDTEVQALYQNKANTPKYFPTPTNEIKEDSLELATSGGVKSAIKSATSQFANWSKKSAIYSAGSTDKYIKIISAPTSSVSRYINMLANRTDETVDIQSLSQNWRSNIIRSTFFRHSKALTTVGGATPTRAYSAYLIEDANHDLWVKVVSYSSVVIELWSNRDEDIVGVEGTPQTTYIIDGYSHKDDRLVNDVAENSQWGITSGGVFSTLQSYSNFMKFNVSSNGGTKNLIDYIPMGSAVENYLMIVTVLGLSSSKVYFGLVQSNIYNSNYYFTTLVNAGNFNITCTNGQNGVVTNNERYGAEVVLVKIR